MNICILLYINQIVKIYNMLLIYIHKVMYIKYNLKDFYPMLKMVILFATLSINSIKL